MSQGQNEANRQLFVKKTPTGLAGPEHFEARSGSIPKPGPGEVLVQSHYLSMDAALRLILRNSPDFLFRLAPGDLVRNTVAGQVVNPTTQTFSPAIT